MLYFMVFYEIPFDGYSYTDPDPVVGRTIAHVEI
jgi:hypothetical protein